MRTLVTIIFCMLLGVAGFGIPVERKAQISSETMFNSVNVTNTIALTANPYRTYLRVQNVSASGDMFITTSASTSGTNVGIELGPDDVWEPVIVPVNPIYFFTISGSVSASVIEGN